LSWSRVGFSSALLLFFFIVQESAVSKINFPIAGFSLYLCVVLGLMALEDRFGAISFGFIAGIVLDFSPSSDSPFGKWALILTLIGYLFSRNRESIGDFTERPIAFILLVTAGATISLVMFLIFGVIVGENNGSMLNNLKTVFGNALWTLLFSSILLPAIVKLRAMTLTSRERI
jgi:rod shape-determining protein MreD